MRNIAFLTGLLLVLLASAVQAQRSWDVDILAETFGFDDETRKSVALEDLHQGCPARDCIPSIDKPLFVTADDAVHVDDDDVVLALAWKGQYRAYPARILDRHEIVNDTVAGTPLAITWCPLCGSAVGVHREVAGTITEFGVSGVLYNSDLVFYDRATGTLWDQIEAKGIVGPLTGEQLELIPVTMTKWARWREAHPDTLVLSLETGFDRDYSADRYAKYRETTDLMFPVSRADNRVHAKTVVYGFDFEGHSVAYAASLLEEHGTYRHELGGEPVAVTFQNDGSVTLERSGRQHAPVRLYWFAWYTFHPDTELVH